MEYCPTGNSLNYNREPDFTDRNKKKASKAVYDTTIVIFFYNEKNTKVRYQNRKSALSGKKFSAKFITVEFNIKNLAIDPFMFYKKRRVSVTLCYF